MLASASLGEDSPLDIVRTSVRTDPGLAMRTRKGTGFYKVPSLKGLWYRGHYLHDGSVASLEEMFARFHRLCADISFHPRGHREPDVSLMLAEAAAEA